MRFSIKSIQDGLNKNLSSSELSELLFQLGHENEIDQDVIDIEITPNRGDCLSVRGIQRELNYFCSQKKEFNDIYDEEIEKIDFGFVNRCVEDCPKISFLKLEIDSPPTKYKDYLEDYFIDLKLTKNNFFTDVSNYIQYETGQPTHCYDFSKLDGSLSLQRIKEKIKFTTLINKEIELGEDSLVFRDQKKIVNFAGIMGGLNSACNGKTNKILLECAFFNPSSIIGKTIPHDIKSDAAYRFERGTDSEIHEYVIRRFLYIVNDHTEIKDVKIQTIEYQETKTKEIKFDLDKIEKILGMQINKSKSLEILRKLGFKIVDALEVPSFRSDINGINDIAEELGRVIGYDNIPRNEITISNEDTTPSDIDNKLRSYMVKKGFSETINIPFTEKTNESIAIDNPLDKNKSYFRTSIEKSLIENLLFNERRQKDSVKIFEISNIYKIANDSISACRKIAIICSGRVGKDYTNFSKIIDQKYLSELFKDFPSNKKIVFKEIPRTNLKSKSKKAIFYFEFDLDDIQEINISSNELEKDIQNIKKFQGISDFPSIIRDLSFKVTNTSSMNDLINLLDTKEIENLKEKFIFDFYFDQKRKEIKLGYRFRFQSYTKTLLDSEVDSYIDDIVESTLNIEGINVPGYQT